MGRLVLRGAALSMAASLILAAGDTRPAQATPETTLSVTGTWRGFFRGDEGPSVTPSVLEITSQDRRRFSGELNVGGSAFEIAGTIAESGNVNIVGEGRDGMVVANLCLHDFGGGAAVFDGKLKLLFDDDDDDAGLVLVLRSFAPDPQSPPPNVTGHYTGATTSAADGKTATMTAQFVHDTQGQAPTTFSGSLEVIRMNYTGVGTIDGQGRVVIIGMGADGPAGFQANFANDQFIGKYVLTLIRMNFTGDDNGTFGIARTVRPEGARP